MDLVLNAPGLATAGSPLPASDIARIIADDYEGGALGTWLDGPGDRFMHLLEDVQMRSNTAFALGAGGRVEAFALIRDLVGRSAPLNAGGNGTLDTTNGQEPDGALALAALFLGPVSASGLRGLVQAFTRLPARVVEFAGARIATARPARVGAPMGLMLGCAASFLLQVWISTSKAARTRKRRPGLGQRDAEDPCTCWQLPTSAPSRRKPGCTCGSTAPMCHPPPLARTPRSAASLFSGPALSRSAYRSPLSYRSTSLTVWPGTRVEPGALVRLCRVGAVRRQDGMPATK